jgi:aspartyl-tRNA(Asn)/glutamyl-tRNA(Gln) amidotransferase subunit B
MHPRYEVVIGLEVHAQLRTSSKLFCGDSTRFGAEPNTQVSPLTLAHPGTLPYLNREALEHALRMGLACGSSISRRSYFARKNYFYPDLPKGYQISQHHDPVCLGGSIHIQLSDGISKDIRLTRIHLEEDAGKSIHDQDPSQTLLDYNRAGTPLIEIVTEPDIRSAEEAFVFLTEIRKLVRWIGVCDGNMEEGSLRCDANISLRLHGDPRLGTRVEVKNLNSIRHVRRAIEIEVERLAVILDAGAIVRQETRSFQASDETTFAIRTKEDADDYRYFPEPDLPPFHITEDWLDRLMSSLPSLPEVMIARFQHEYGLSEYDARQLCEEKDLCDYFLSHLPATDHAKPFANWLLGPVRSLINERGGEWVLLNISRDEWADLLLLVSSGRISFSSASQHLFPRMMSADGRLPSDIAAAEGLLQDAGGDEIEGWVEQALQSMPDKVLEYRKGKKGLIGLFMGEVKKLSRGKADPRKTQEILQKKLNAAS